MFSRRATTTIYESLRSVASVRAQRVPSAWTKQMVLKPPWNITLAPKAPSGLPHSGHACRLEAEGWARAMAMAVSSMTVSLGAEFGP